MGLLGLHFYCVGILKAPLFKLGIALGGRALAYVLCKLGLPLGLALAIACFAKALITEGTVSEVLWSPLRMLPAGSDSGGNADSGGWQKYLNLPSDSEGQGQGIESDSACRKRDRSTDPGEDVGPSSVRPRGDSESAPVVGPVPLNTWNSFDERVLVEPMPDSSSTSVDGAINAGAPNPPVPPQLPQPLLSDEMRRHALYQRYLVNNWGGSDDLRRMVSTIDAQMIVERSVEAALVDDGFHPGSIVGRYRDIRGLLHSPQGQLLSVRTYESYLTEMRELGTRESVPYRRVLRAIHSMDLVLERRSR
jgi:hypothetical protein